MSTKKRKNFIKLIKNRQREIGTLLFFIGTVAVFSLLFLRRSETLEARIFLTEREWAKEWSNYPDRFYLENLEVGMKTRDELGRTTIEVLDVNRPLTPYYHEVALVTIKIKGTYNKRSEEFSFNGKPLVVGDYQRIKVGNILLQGYLIGLSNQLPKALEKEYTIKGLLDERYQGTTGMDNTLIRAVPKTVAASIEVGSKIFNNKRQVIAEVIDLKLFPAERKIISSGIYRSIRDPDFTSGEITMKLRTTTIDDIDYWNFILPVQVGTNFQLSFENVVFPITITEIEKIETVNN